MRNFGTNKYNAIEGEYKKKYGENSMIKGRHLRVYLTSSDV